MYSDPDDCELEYVIGTVIFFSILGLIVTNQCRYQDQKIN